MKQPVSSRRVFAVVMVLAAAAIGLRMWTASVRSQNELQSVSLDSPVDLSRPGVTTAPYQQWSPLPHAQIVKLAVEGDRDEAVEALKPLKAKLLIADAAGTVHAECPLELIQGGMEGSPPHLGRFPPFAKGTYTATIEVEQAAEALSGRTQRLLIDAEVCGLEMLPIAIQRLLAAGIWLVGFIVAAFTTPNLIRYGWRQALR